MIRESRKTKYTEEYSRVPKLYLEMLKVLIEEENKYRRKRNLKINGGSNERG